MGKTLRFLTNVPLLPPPLDRTDVLHWLYITPTQYYTVPILHRPYITPALITLALITPALITPALITPAL